MKNLYLFYALLSCCTLIGCHSKPQTASTDNSSGAVTSAINNQAQTTSSDTSINSAQGAPLILIEIKGAPIDSARENKQAIQIQLDSGGNKISGYAGCNNLSGQYELNGNNGIKFSELVTTKIACPDQQNENDFLQAMGDTDSYEVRDNVLTLKQAEKPLLRFRIPHQHE